MSLPWFSLRTAHLRMQKRLEQRTAACPGLQAEGPESFRDKDAAKGCWVQLLALLSPRVQHQCSRAGAFPLPQEDTWLTTA